MECSEFENSRTAATSAHLPSLCSGVSLPAEVGTICTSGRGIPRGTTYAWRRGTGHLLEREGIILSLSSLPYSRAVRRGSPQRKLRHRRSQDRTVGVMMAESTGEMAADPRPGPSRLGR